METADVTALLRRITEAGARLETARADLAAALVEWAALVRTAHTEGADAD